MTDTSLPDSAGGEVDELAALYIRHEAPIDLARVPAVLGAADLAWLGEQVEVEGPLRRYRSDLEVHLRGMAPIALRKSAMLDVGLPVADDLGWALRLEWQAATLAPLFPVFSGVLRVRADHLVVDGRYAPPGGRLGRAADGLLMGTVARGTARWLLRRIATRLG